jgi:hypothetical protein
MRPQGVDNLGALADQHIASCDAASTEFGRFDPHEAHGRSPNRFADRLGGPCSGAWPLQLIPANRIFCPWSSAS